MSQHSISVGGRRITLLLGILLVMAILMPSAQAIGVTPGMKTIDFSPGLKQTAEFTILNNEHKRFNALLYVEDELKDYVKLDKTIIEFTEEMNSQSYTYTIELPREIEEPGDHFARIIIMELPPDMGIEGGKTKVLGTVAVAHLLKVKVPFPGKFAKTELRVIESEPGEVTTFYVKGYNLGEQDIANAVASIDILGPTNEKIVTLESESKSIKSKTTEEFIIPWEADVNAGMYHAVVTLRYDDRIARMEKNFGVGNLRIDLRGVTVKDYRLGGVAKFNIDIESKWNEKIAGVYGEIDIMDPNGDIIANFKSASTDIEPLGRATIYAYWDTEGVEKGTYKALLTLHYSGQVTETELEVTLNFDSIDTRIPGLAGAVVQVTGEGALAIDPSILVLITVLVGINGGWFFYFRKRRLPAKRAAAKKAETSEKEE